MLFGWGEMGVGTAATGDIDVSWPKGRNRLVSGRVDVGLARRPDGRTPLDGRFEWSAEDGTQTYETVELETPEMSGRVSGIVGVDNQAELSVEGETTDLVATDSRPTTSSPGCAGPSATGRPTPQASSAPAPFAGGGRGRPPSRSSRAASPAATSNMWA
jgi:hypothetical protein